MFKDRRTELFFPGSGQPLHNEKECLVENAESRTKIHSLDSIHEKGSGELSPRQPGKLRRLCRPVIKGRISLLETKVPVEKFLERLPPSVIKNGKIIDIRSGIENTIKASSTDGTENQVSVIDTPVIQEIKAR